MRPEDALVQAKNEFILAWLRMRLMDGFPRSLQEIRSRMPRITGDEIENILELMVMTGDAEEVKGYRRGFTVTRYRLTDEGAIVADDEEGADAESDEPEEPDGAAGDAGEAVHEGAEGAAEHRVGVDGAPA